MKFFARVSMIALISLLTLGCFDAQALTFSNPRVLLTLAPGESRQEIIRIINELDSSEVVGVQVRDFIQGEEEGSPVFVNQSDSGISKFISLSVNQFKMNGSERRDFRYTISVPADTLPGTYFGAIHFSSTSLDSRNLVAVTGPLIFITVRGSQEQRLGFGSGINISETLDAHPVQIKIRLKNEGVNIAVPKGKLEIKNMAGSIVRYLSLNREDRTILPHSSRELTASIPFESASSGISNELNQFGFGRYQVSLSVDGSSEMKNVLVGEYWVFPWRISLALTGFGLLIATVLGIFLPHRHEDQIVEPLKRTDKIS